MEEQTEGLGAGSRPRVLLGCHKRRRLERKTYNQILLHRESAPCRRGGLIVGVHFVERGDESGKYEGIV
jgi:hypothetical protein